MGSQLTTTDAVTAKVHFHVITDGSEGNVSDEELATLLDLLNVAFAGGQGGPASDITFDHVGTDRTDTPPGTAPSRARRRRRT